MEMEYNGAEWRWRWCWNRMERNGNMLSPFVVRHMRRTTPFCMGIGDGARAFTRPTASALIPFSSTPMACRAYLRAFQIQNRMVYVVDSGSQTLVHNHTPQPQPQPQPQQSAPNCPRGPVPSRVRRSGLLVLACVWALRSTSARGRAQTPSDGL